MSYSVQVAKSVEEMIADWQLPHEIRSEVYRRLYQDLSQEGFSALRHAPHPINAYLYSFVKSDASTPRVQYFFHFQMKVSQDETCLVAVNAGHSRQETFPRP